MHGVIIIDKPSGMTSHDVVARIRRVLNGAKVGHAGTLDPLATGVLPIMIGNATKLSAQFMNGDKEYLARVKFGETTDTDDVQGKILSNRPVPADLEGKLKGVLEKFRGTIEQVPPQFSAVKVNGVPSYKLARRCRGGALSSPKTGGHGGPPLLKPRRVEIKELRVEEVSSSFAIMRIKCSKGTYIRALARDVGEELGCGGHIVSLKRLASSGFNIEDAHKLSEISTLQDVSRVLAIPHQLCCNKT